MVRGEEALEIRRLYAEGVSISELARRTGHDRKTIRRIVQAESPAERPARRRRESKLAPFREYVLQRMELGVLNAVRIHAELQELGYRGGLTVLRDFMRPHRPTHTARATPRYETPPGQAQLDLFHFDYLAGTVIQRLYYLALVLSYSRYIYGEFLPQLNKLTVLQALRRGLEFLAGAPAEILSDNTSVLVRRRHPDGRVEGSPSTWTWPSITGSFPGLAGPIGRVPRARTSGSGATCVRLFGPGSSSTWRTSTASIWPGSMG